MTDCYDLSTVVSLVYNMLEFFEISYMIDDKSRVNLRGKFYIACLNSQNFNDI
jgi:hypothetical protein